MSLVSFVFSRLKCYNRKYFFDLYSGGQNGFSILSIQRSAKQTPLRKNGTCFPGSRNCSMYHFLSYISVARLRFPRNHVCALIKRWGNDINPTGQNRACTWHCRTCHICLPADLSFFRGQHLLWRIGRNVTRDMQYDGL